MSCQTVNIYGKTNRGYTFDAGYLDSALSLGNRYPDCAGLFRVNCAFPESRLNYPLFFLKHPEMIPYVRDSDLRLMETANRYFDENAYAFHVSEKPVCYPTYDFFKIKNPTPGQRPANNGFLIGTSLTHKRLDVQKEAVESWLCQGFDVLSVNYPEEIELLRPLFPEVRFVSNTRDSLEQHGRKLIYLDDIFQALKAQSGKYKGFGLINSDIILFKLDLEKLTQTCRESAVFSHRLELPGRQAYIIGLDAFFMNEETLTRCCARSSSFMLGAPWWDFYLPALLMATSVRLLQAVPPLCGHLKHPIGYSDLLWRNLSKDFYLFFKDNVQKMPILDSAKLFPLLHDKISPWLLSDLFLYIHLNLPEYVNLTHLAPTSDFVSKRRSRAAILGNGSSLKGFDFQNSLSGYTTFGMNAAYRFWDRINWYPDYYSCLDPVVGLSHKNEICRLIKRADEYGIRGFLLCDNLIKELGSVGDNPKVTNFDQLFRDFPFFFRTLMVTTGSHTMAWAALLGYRDIVLFGIDANYNEILNEARKKEGITLELMETPKVNPNYFFDDYQRQGDLYQIPNPTLESPVHLCSWRDMKEPLRLYGVSIVNANPNSQVDAFTKCCFNEIASTLEQEKSHVDTSIIRKEKLPTNEEALSWLISNIYLKGYKLADLFTKRSMRRVAVYGIGVVGKIVANDLSTDSEIELFLIDKNLAGHVYVSKEIYSLEQFDEEVDVVFISVMRILDEIRIALKNSTVITKTVMTMSELIDSKDIVQ